MVKIYLVENSADCHAYAIALSKKRFPEEKLRDRPLLPQPLGHAHLR